MTWCVAEQMLEKMAAGTVACEADFLIVRLHN